MTCTDGRAALAHRGDNAAVSRLWEDPNRPLSFEWWPHTADLDLRDVDERLPISVRSGDSSVVLTVVIDMQADDVELTLSYSAARRVALALVLATRVGDVTSHVGAVADTAASRWPFCGLLRDRP